MIGIGAFWRMGFPSVAFIFEIAVCVVAASATSVAPSANRVCPIVQPLERSVSKTIPIALLMGGYLKWIRPHRVLEATADVMNRDYVVRSGVPIVGPLIAWIRRTLTSHLWEPYLDPTLQRQVEFNAHTIQVLRQLADQLPAEYCEVLVQQQPAALQRVRFLEPCAPTEIVETAAA